VISTDSSINFPSSNNNNNNNKKNIKKDAKPNKSNIIEKQRNFDQKIL